MGFGRSFFLWASRNSTLRERLPRYSFVRKSVTRFMPGEEIHHALDAAEKLQTSGLSTVLTHLGENVTSRQETHAVKDHYMQLLADIQSRGVNAHISVKLTELGLDQDADLCLDNVRSLAKSALEKGNYLWIDMEGSNYTTATLDIFRRLRAEYKNTGVCLQSYLYRTMQDLESLFPLNPGIRLVKGAYAEPPDIAYPRKADNDENYFNLARTLLLHAKDDYVKVGLGTHDQKLIRRILDLADTMNVRREQFEIQMLYGIRMNDQLRLHQEGCKVRVLISYGSFWFPWYMRRLAERPANVLFVLRNLW
jgi:proline dehydrogenase